MKRRRRRTRRNPSGAAWATAAAGGTIAALGIYKAYSDYQTAQDEQQRANDDRTIALTSSEDASKTLINAANNLEMAAQTRQSSAIMFGVFGVIGLGIAGFALWRG